MLSLDCETTGLDLYHGARPFAVSVCDQDGRNTLWEWEVDPHTRKVRVLHDDVREIANLLKVAGGWANFDRETVERHVVVTQNGKFDITALHEAGVIDSDDFPWVGLRDTLVCGHLLASNREHGLDKMAKSYCGLDIKPYETALEMAVKKCRSVIQQARARLKRWGDSGPSPKKKGGKKKVEVEVEIRFTAEGGFETVESLPDLGVTPEQREEWEETRELGSWVIADEYAEKHEATRGTMPSATKETWRFDYWLPRAYAKYRWETSEAHQQLSERVGDYCHDQEGPELPGFEWRPPGTLGESDGGHPYWTVLSKYLNADTYATIRVWLRQSKELTRRKLWAYFDEAMKQIRCLYRMEKRGMTLCASRLDGAHGEFSAEAAKLKADMVKLAKGRRYELCVPDGPRNNSLIKFMFGPDPVSGQSPLGNSDMTQTPAGCLLLEWAYRTDAGGPALDTKNAIPHYLDTLPDGCVQRRFVQALSDYRKRMTAVSYLSAYRRFMLPESSWGLGEWYRIHSTVNPCGSATLRKSSERPNAQNVSAKSQFNCRRPFGPVPGREWWCLDYENLELRLPAYESGEQDLIDLFENPGPPFYGSEHLLNFSVVYPDLWEEAVRRGGGLEHAAAFIKKEWKDTWYKRCKNGDFAVGYGAIDRPDGYGTADVTFGRPGSHARLKARFAKKEALNRKWVAYAQKYGYVETMPDRTVDPTKGYPLLVTRNNWGGILETVPLNYHIQGTACWAKNKALVRCQQRLDEWRDDDGFDAYCIMDVHDELDFDFPAGGRANLWRVLELKTLMEQSGDDIGIPLRVSYAWHPRTWADAEELPEAA